MKVDSIVDRACQHIQEWIVTGRFKPGEQIKEENVSTTAGNQPSACSGSLENA